MFRRGFSGDGGYPRSIVAGLYAGGGGFLRSTVAALASGKGRLIQLCLRRLLVTESGGLQSSALPSWNPRSFGLW
ncbi:BnaCnng48960D [Brassica napus]|uniref:BnaCnng48960D protein n=1 Tax=Brassica napus TaxID=3708 RepID=A0A078JGQ6_BRANA|nr:BnaCnng48960D [Brassica napus]